MAAVAAAKPAAAARCGPDGGGGRAVSFEETLSAPGDTSEKLFELANRPAVGLSIAGGQLRVLQDRHTTEHSGGVVWETAFFLARYLERHVLPSRPPRPRPRVAELGAGCGLLGLALARLGCRVLLTDQPSALENLRANAVAASSGSAGLARRTQVAQLSWGADADVAAACAKGPFDLVVASDVNFAVRLVEPLLRTIAALLGTARQAGIGEAECWLCLQQRDPDAHKALLDLMPSLFRVRKASFEGLPGFEAAAELECLLLRLRLKKRPAEALDSAGDAADAEDTGLVGAEVKRPKSRRRRP